MFSIPSAADLLCTSRPVIDYILAPLRLYTRRSVDEVSDDRDACTLHSNNLDTYQPCELHCVCYSE